MRPPKPHYPLNAKLILVGITLVLLLLFALRSNYSPSSSNTTLAPNKIDYYSNVEDNNNKTPPCPISSCTKIPPSLSDALIHYSTSSITPQQTLNEISVTSKVLQMKSPCNFLVFGLGHDSLMWSALNYGGRTIFLEEDISWITKIKELYPTLVSYHVEYDSKVNEADKLMEIGKSKECSTSFFVSDVRNAKCELALKNLPNEVYETKWDLIMVDAPTGYYGEAPGRMTAIYTAGLIARLNQGGGETHVFVHDVNREVEDKFSKEFLCQGYMKKQEGRLRHFTIPSHKDDQDKPFCPN